MSRPLADTMPAVTVPPRPNGLPTASTQSPIRGLPSDKLREREVRAALDLDQGEVGARIGADHLGGVGLAVVGRDLDLVGAVDDVVVGHGIAVGRDEEAGALARSRPRPRADHPQARRQAIRSAEAAEEALHRRARLERRILVVGAVVVARGLSLMWTFTEITDGFTRSTMSAKPIGCATLRTSLLTCACAGLEKRSAGQSRAEAVNGDAEAGDDRSHQRELARGEQRTGGLPVGRKRCERSVGRSVIRRSPEP